VHAEGVQREPAEAPEVLSENRFLAARDGMEARVVEPASGRRPVRDRLAELLDACVPHARALGCAGALADVRELAAAPGAARQRELARAPAASRASSRRSAASSPDRADSALMCPGDQPGRAGGRDR